MCVCVCVYVCVCVCVCVCVYVCVCVTSYINLSIISTAISSKPIDTNNKHGD